MQSLAILQSFSSPVKIVLGEIPPHLNAALVCQPVHQVGKIPLHATLNLNSFRVRTFFFLQKV